MHYACTIQRTFAHPRQVGSSGGAFRAGECGPALPLGPKRCEGHAGDAVVCGTLCALTAVQFFTIFKKWKEIEYDCAAYAPSISFNVLVLSPHCPQPRNIKTCREQLAPRKAPV